MMGRVGGGNEELRLVAEITGRGRFFLGGPEKILTGLRQRSIIPTVVLATKALATELLAKDLRE